MKTTTFIKLALYENARIIALSALKRAEMSGQDIRALRADIMSGGAEGGDGVGLVSEAYIVLLDYADRVPEAAVVPEAMSLSQCIRAIMDYPHIIRALDRRVIVREEDSAKFENKVTTARKEAYSAVWRTFRASCLQDNGKYTYIEDFALDWESGAEEAVYKRLPRGMEARNVQEARKVEYNMQALDLTEAQKRIVYLRLRGYGQKAIASYLGITKQGVQKHMALIRKKAEAAGMAAEPEAAVMPEAVTAEALARDAFNKYK